MNIESIEDRLRLAWIDIFLDVPLTNRVQDPIMVGVYDIREELGLAGDLTHNDWTVGHMTKDSKYVPNAGPFETLDAAISVLIGMIANNRSARLLARIS
jgi:hypothetical protein